MKLQFRFLPVALVGLFVPLAAHAHVTLMSPPSRHGPNQQKAGPCGANNSMRGNRVTTFKPGEKIMVEWDETIFHRGHFRIAFLADGNDFPKPTGYDDIKDPPQLPILADGLFADHTARRTYVTEVTLPNMTCDTCTLQLIQVMRQGNFNGADGGSLYYACADIKLEGDVAAPDAGAPDASGMGGMGGAMGTGGMGGAMGTGGMGGAMAGAGGAAAGAGGASGGSGGAAGASSAGSGGSSAGSGGSSNPGSGGESNGGSGGSSNAGSGGSGSGGKGGSSNGSSRNDSSTGCAMAGGSADFGGLGIVLFGLGLWLGRRRRAKV